MNLGCTLILVTRAPCTYTVWDKEVLTLHCFDSLGGRCLKDLCMSVISSALLQFGPLDPDKLDERLPTYVPTRIKSSIVRRMKAHMLQLVQFPPCPEH